MTAVIETRTVSKIYKTGPMEVKAVDEASFQIQAGEFVGLVGPSGSGKTTMLAMLAALLLPTHGEVILDGTNLAQMNDRDRVKFRREKIGFTFQSNNLVPFLTVRENVELMLRLNKELRCQLLQTGGRIAGTSGINRSYEYPPQPTFRRQKQRVAIARSLIHNPQRSIG